VNDRSYDDMSAVRTCLILFLAMALAACGPKSPAGGGAASGASGEALIGGPFQLVDQNGRPTDQRVLKGKWSLVFFGYTYCPDVCPTTLQVLAQAKARLGDDAHKVQVVFISVDPARDTPVQIKGYLETPSFPQPTLGLTGSDAQIAAAAKTYRVYYKKQGEGEGYSMAHTAIIYLMNPDGKFDRPLAESLTPVEMAAQIKDAMRSGPKAGG
jgi:protein SCO1/2